MVDRYRNDDVNGEPAFKRATQNGNTREEWFAVTDGDYLGIVANRIGRVSTNFAFDPVWTEVLARLTAEGGALLLYSGEESALVEFGADGASASQPP